MGLEWDEVEEMMTDSLINSTPASYTTVQMFGVSKIFLLLWKKSHQIVLTKAAFIWAKIWQKQ